MRYTVLAAAFVAAASAGVLKRDLQTQTISGWTAMGCWSDMPLNRTLTHLVNVGEGISGTQCQAQCQDLGYLYAGNEFRGQCYCDDSLNYAVQVPDSDCNMTCPADLSQPCGAANRINVYYQGPSQRYNVPGWNNYGCVSDSPYARGLRYRMYADAMTPQVCTDLCSAASYSLAGLEYMSECWCDNYLQNNQSLADPVTCNMGCSGDSSVACGGAGKMNILYAAGTTVTAQPVASHDVSLPAGWSYAGCYSDDVGARALSSYIQAPSTGLTIEACVSGCAAQNATWAGAEYQDECYCGTSVNNGQAPVSDGCTLLCSGDNSEVCGGSNRLSMYMYTAPE